MLPYVFMTTPLAFPLQIHRFGQAITPGLSTAIPSITPSPPTQDDNEDSPASPVVIPSLPPKQSKSKTSRIDPRNSKCITLFAQKYLTQIVLLQRKRLFTLPNKFPTTKPHFRSKYVLTSPSPLLDTVRRNSLQRGVAAGHPLSIRWILLTKPLPTTEISLAIYWRISCSVNRVHRSSYASPRILVTTLGLISVTFQNKKRICKLAATE